MKKVLRCLTLLTLSILGKQTTHAQCSASDILIQNIVPVGVQIPGSCNAKFDLSFTMQANGGNKFIFFHAWRPDLYPNYFDCVNGEPSSPGNIAAPDASDLVDAFINLGINNAGPNPVLLSVYPADAGVTLNVADSVTVSTLPDGSFSFVVHGLVALLPGDCNGPIVLTGDFWSSQSANAQNAQCVSCNINYALNFMLATGLANCANLTYFVNLSNRTNSALAGNYLVYADVNNDGVLSTNVDSLIRDTTAFTIAAGVGLSTLITGSIPTININQNLFVQVLLDSPADGTSIFEILSTQCGVLPVTFHSFTASRVNRETVQLRWETATEHNNQGFYIERNTGGSWTTVTFVPTLAPGGISSSLLTYTYTDINPFKGTTQYRIRQVDVDGMARYSEIRQVKGEQGKDILIYPNPSDGGAVNVQFAEDGIRDIQLFDMSGRAVKQWNGMTKNNLRIENLAPGVYTIRVMVRETNVVVTEKIVMH